MTSGKAHQKPLQYLYITGPRPEMPAVMVGIDGPGAVDITGEKPLNSLAVFLAYFTESGITESILYDWD